MRGIVVEGPDGAGKSTLLAKLAKGLGREALHTGGSNKALDELNYKCREQAYHLSQGRILDRCTFISDPIYKMALGQQTLLTPPILRARLWTVDPLIIYCRRNTVAEMLEAIIDAKKDHKPPEYLEEVRRNYPKIVAGYDREMELLSNEGFTVIRYNWTTDDYHALEELVRSCVA